MLFRSGIQKAITWVKENANIEFPGFDKEVFSLGAAASLDDSGDSQTFLSSPGSEAADDITGAVLKLTNFMKEAIIQEIYISLALIGVYMIIVFIGLGCMLIGMFGRQKTRAEGGPTYATSSGVYTGHNRQSPTHRGGEFPTKAFDDAPETAHPDGAGAYAPSYAGEKSEAPLGMSRKEVPVGRAGIVGGHHGRQSSYGHIAEKDGVSPI